MAKNIGVNPYDGDPEAPLIDLKYNNGITIRGIEPHKRDWRLFGGDWQIAHYQPSTAKGYEIAWPVERKD